MDELRESKTKSAGIRDLFKSSNENKEKIIIVTDNDFFKKKKQERQLSVNLNIKNQTAKNFFQNKELAPLEIKNFKNTTLSDFNFVKKEGSIM